MWHKKILILIVVVSLITLGGVGSLMLSRRGPSKNDDVKGTVTLETVRSEQIGMIAERDTGLTRQPVSREGEQAGQLWRFAQPVSSQQEFVIDANYEQGVSLKKLTGYTNQPLRDSVVTNVNVQLPKQYPEYRELTQRNLSINGIEANETIFEYNSKGVKIKQRLVLYIKSSDTAVYIRAQAKADEYEEINDKYFEPLFSSVKFE